MRYGIPATPQHSPPAGPTVFGSVICLGLIVRAQAKALTHAFYTGAQALGGQGIIQAQCKAIIQEYVPQIMEIIDTLPVDQVWPLPRRTQPPMHEHEEPCCKLTMCSGVIKSLLPRLWFVLQICSFLGLCAASAHSAKAAHQAAAEQPISAVHRKLLAMLPMRSGKVDMRASRLVLPVHRDAHVEAAHEKLRDDPSSTCQMCEMAVTYVRVRVRCPGCTSWVLQAPSQKCSIPTSFMLAHLQLICTIIELLLMSSMSALVAVV